MKNFIWLNSLCLASILLWMGCASAPPISKSVPLEDLFDAACSPGKGIQSVEGSVWLKAKSKEVSGRFAANVSVSSTGTLRLEVTNLFGGTEALITVDHDHYEITGGQGKTEKKDEGYGTWGGIPLHWATNLFLGKIPCPAASGDLKFSTNPERNLIIETPAITGAEAQKFIYTFGQHSGRIWPETLHWERLGQMTSSVDFKFDDPEESTFSPKKWEARSSRGSVKARWKDRELNKNK